MKYIYGLCVLVGVFVVFGTAGASDCGSLELGQIALHGFGGLLVAVVGVLGLKRMEEREGES